MILASDEHSLLLLKDKQIVILSYSKSIVRGTKQERKGGHCCFLRNLTNRQNLQSEHKTTFFNLTNFLPGTTKCSISYVGVPYFLKNYFKIL